MRKVLLAAVAVVIVGGSAANADGVVAPIIENELPKCVNGVGVPGGCFGPNGEIIKAARTAVDDITKGPGEHNDLVGRKGWLRQRLGF
jgi:hypothetical protein